MLPSFPLSLQIPAGLREKPIRAALLTLAAMLAVMPHPARAQATGPASVVSVAAADQATDKDDDDGKGEVNKEGKDKGADKDDDGKDDDDDAKSKTIARYAQPVRAGDLIGRDVVAPLESQDLLGRVRKLVRNGDGELTVVMTYGGLLGVGTRLVCVPVDDLALTGVTIQLKGIGTDELKALPVCDGASEKPVGPDETIRVKLAKPAH